MPVLQKFIADSGYCSRREAERLIREGRVRVNGEKASLGMRIGGDDEVKIDGRKISSLAKDKIYIKLYKPSGYTSTNRQFKNENNVFDLVDLRERLFIVGRLDKDSRGLILLTNDGNLTLELTHPRYEHAKTYRVEVEGCGGREQDIARQLKAGVDIGEGDGRVRAKAVRILERGIFEVKLTEGKKRQIRRMFRAAGCEVTDLIRTEIAGLKLGNLEEGGWRHLDHKEKKILNIE